MHGKINHHSQQSRNIQPAVLSHMLEPPFSTGLNVIFKVKCWSLSSLSLRDIYKLKFSVVPTCEIAKDVMFHKSPPFIVKQIFFTFCTSGYRASGVTSHKIYKPRCARSRKVVKSLPQVKAKSKIL
jgi:hypothetical protein